MDHEIVHLPKEVWKGTILPIRYTTDKYYDVIVNNTENGYVISIEKKSFAEPVTHAPADLDFPDRLYADHWENAFAWGVVEEGRLIAAIETAPEQWSNRLRITELWVADEYQRQGIGHALLEVAKEQARLERRRAIILETQSCNVDAIEFYMHEGFRLVGLDTCCYSNTDIQRKEVRLEFGWFPEEKQKLRREDIEIRPETEDDWYDVELITQRAFWNLHNMGCDEHYLVHKLRRDMDYLPELSRIAVKDGEVIGSIMYSKARVVDGTDVHEVLTFGPFCVASKWQGCGVGGLLLKETIGLAASKGYKGIVIFGEPEYYPRFGFKTCDHFGITTADGRNFSSFMAIELVEGGLKDVKGRFYLSEVFENLPREEVEEYNKKFPRLPKIKFPGHWD
ncbi:MAG TPA: GNAT family N-acetyltransferase [Candidatus Atribacteria bacterium]|nr:GNAT family N-acetyltransferase [Candidatus Atribacteria bacterium]HPT78641.1 GNAT family N-acetyltransferase [Candidatus Atribacteria bacterium]